MIKQIKATMKSSSGIKVVEILDFIVKENDSKQLQTFAIVVDDRGQLSESRLEDLLILKNI